MMENFTNELILKRKEFGRNLVFSLLGIFLIYIIVFVYLQITEPSLPQITLPVLIFSFIGTAYVSYLFSKTTFSFRNTYAIVAFSFFWLIFYLCLLLCPVCITIYCFYIPIIILVLHISNFKITALITALVILLIIFTKNISVYFGITKRPFLTDSDRNIINIVEWIDVIAVAYLSLFLLYYYVELKKAESVFVNDSLIVQNEKNNDENITISQNLVSQDQESVNDRFYELYQQIIDHFEKEKPYQSPEFNIKKLANDLDTNTSYLSRALNTYGKKKFNTLVNEYRISMVKEELAQNLHNKFTLEYVYSKAGFANQPTFNRVFKEYTGLTPSEYIEKLT